MQDGSLLVSDPRGCVYNDRQTVMTVSPFGDDVFVWDAHAGFELRCVDDLKALRIWKNSGVNFLSIDVGYDANPWQKTIKAQSHARDWLARTEGYRVVGTMHDID